VTRAPLARQHRSLAQVDLVRDARELAQLGLRASREQWDLLEELDLRVAAESHVAILTPPEFSCKVSS